MKLRGKKQYVLSTMPWFGSGYRSVELAISDRAYLIFIDDEPTSTVGDAEQVGRIRSLLNDIQWSSIYAESFRGTMEDFGAYTIQRVGDARSLHVGEPLTENAMAPPKLLEVCKAFKALCERYWNLDSGRKSPEALQGVVPGDPAAIPELLIHYHLGLVSAGDVVLWRRAEACSGYATPSEFNSRFYAA
jgi:hypothetical protein